MWADPERGLPTEIDSTNGAARSLGHARGVPIPTHTLLTALVVTREPRAGAGRRPVAA